MPVNPALTTPTVDDPFDGVIPASATPDPHMPRQLPDGGILIPSTYGGRPFVLSNLMTDEQTEALCAKLEAATEAETYKQQAETAARLIPALESAAKELPTVKAELESAKHQITALTATMATMHQPRPQPEQAEDNGEPIPGAKIYPVDPFYSTPVWFEMEVASRLKDFGRSVLALLGPAGVGKTKGLIEWVARTKTPCVYLNCKGSDPNEWFEYRSVVNGETVWSPGEITKVVQRGARCVVILDEVDTSAEDFKMRLAGLMEADRNQRSLTTPFGSFPCSPNIQWVVAMNGNGTNPSSRHRGTLPQALLNRFTWVQVPMIDEDQMHKILLTRYAGMDGTMLKHTAVSVVRLMTAAQRGELDVDVTIRTAMKVCEDWHLGPQVAWNGAVLSAIDDPGMRAKAVAILSDTVSLT